MDFRLAAEGLVVSKLITPTCFSNKPHVPVISLAIQGQTTSTSVAVASTGKQILSSCLKALDSPCNVASVYLYTLTKYMLSTPQRSVTSVSLYGMNRLYSLTTFGIGCYFSYLVRSTGNRVSKTMQIRIVIGFAQRNALLHYQV